ncbi:MAG: SIS domain-containing protein [Ktedonobacteraceae bacterium]
MMIESFQPRQQTLMLQEIQEQPAALRRTLSNTLDAVQYVAAETKRRAIKLVLLAARGTSDHAALYAQYLFQYLNGIPVALATPSLYTLYGASLRLEQALVIGISQSGESPDIVEVVAQARVAGALTIGITNHESSLLATTAEYTLLCHAGLERSVAATKTYTTTGMVLAMLSAYMSGGEALQESLELVPDTVAAVLKSEASIARIAARYVYARDCVVLGRAFQYSTARETALKLEETCYIVATPFSSADFRHGPAALVERGLPVIVFAPPGKTSADSLVLLQWLRERNADSLVIAEEEHLLELATIPIQLALPSVTQKTVHRTRGTFHGNDPTQAVGTTIAELLAPLAYIVPGQLLAQHIALQKGLNPDQPRSLTKVTRTM